MTKTATTTAKPKGVSVHLGLNSVSAGPLRGLERRAQRL